MDFGRRCGGGRRRAAAAAKSAAQPMVLVGRGSIFIWRGIIAVSFFPPYLFAPATPYLFSRHIFRAGHAVTFLAYLFPPYLSRRPRRIFFPPYLSRRPLAVGVSFFPPYLFAPATSRIFLPAISFPTSNRTLNIIYRATMAAAERAARRRKPLPPLAATMP